MLAPVQPTVVFAGVLRRDCLDGTLKIATISIAIPRRGTLSSITECKPARQQVPDALYGGAATP